MQPQPLTTPFTPDEAQAARIIDSMSNPDLSPRDIASEHKITLESLTLFLARPDIQERLDNLESAITRRTRLLATDSLPGAVTVLRNMLQAYMWEESKITVHPSDTKAVQQRRIAGESTRRAAYLLYRLARFQSPVARLPRVARLSEPGVSPPVARPSRPGVPRPPAPTLEQLLADIHQLAPTLLTLDEPAAPPRSSTGDSQEAPLPPTTNTSPPDTPHPTPHTRYPTPLPPTPTPMPPTTSSQSSPNSSASAPTPSSASPGASLTPPSSTSSTTS